MHESIELEGQRVREWYCGNRSVTIFGEAAGVNCWGPNIQISRILMLQILKF